MPESTPRSQTRAFLHTRPGRRGRWLRRGAFLAAGAAATAISVAWIDRPLARAVARVFPPDTTLPDAPDLLVYFVAGLSAVTLLVWHVAGRRGHHRLASAALLLAGAGPLSLGLKYLGKWMFGRAEVRMYLSSPHVREFHWFAGTGPFLGFPSGHMLVATALAGVLIHVYPRLRPWCAIVLVALAAALLATSYHYLGDLIAGTLLGQAVAWVVIGALARPGLAAGFRIPRRGAGARR